MTRRSHAGMHVNKLTYIGGILIEDNTEGSASTLRD